MFYDEIMLFFFRRLSYLFDGFLFIVLGELLLLNNNNILRIKSI